MRERVFRLALVISLLLGGCAVPGWRQRTPAGPTAPPAGDLPPTATLPPTASPSATETAAPTGTPAPDKEGGRRSRSLLEEYLPGGRVIAESEHFVIHARSGYFPVERDWWLEQSEIIYAYVAERLGVEGRSKVQIAFLPPEERPCPVRGLASRESPPTVLIYADESAPRGYLLAVLAHELGHAIPGEGFRGGIPADTALAEGLATWAAGSYWLEWKDAPSLDALVRGYLAEGLYEPLTESYAMDGIYPWQEDTGPSQDCLARRDRVYTTWAAFTGYLVKTYGWEKVHRLYETPLNPTPTPAAKDSSPRPALPTAYQSVFGKTLAELEAEWLARLRREIASGDPSAQNSVDICCKIVA